MRQSQQRASKEGKDHREDTEIGIIHTVDSPCRCAESIAEGLDTLGYKVAIYNSEDIFIYAHHIADKSSLVIDHTDTFCGRGGLRSFVRLILEANGARLVGADASASMLADDKYAAKKRLSELGVSTPKGILIAKESWKPLCQLKPPLILKTAYEHMSRGVCIAEDVDRAYALSKELLHTFNQPVIVEEFIQGREMAVSMIHDPEKGLTMLPPVEWRIKSKEMFQTKHFKLLEQDIERDDIMPTTLTKKEVERLKALSMTAFKSLGMRDYCRFDIKLTPEGEFFFLEANITPSLEKTEAMAMSARWAGLRYNELLERIILSAEKRYGRVI